MEKRTRGRIFIGYDFLRKGLCFAFTRKDKTNHTILEDSIGKCLGDDVRHNSHRLQRNERIRSQSYIQDSHITHAPKEFLYYPPSRPT